MVPSLREFKSGSRSQKTETWVIYGPPGTGKSRFVRERVGLGGFWKSPNNNWWDGYTGQADVVMDDYKSWLPWSELLQVMDEYPLRVQVKGGFTTFVAKRVFITTNFKPAEWYGKPDDPDKDRKYPLEAILRRVEHWVVFVPGPGWPLTKVNADGSWNCEMKTFSARENDEFSGWRAYML